MWTPTTRRQHSRAGLRYETDLTDAEWAVIGPLMPAPAPCGRPPVWTLREVLNAIFYVPRGGIAWRLAERFFAWINRNRRLRKDPEATLASAKAFLYAAAVILVRRLARSA